MALHAELGQRIWELRSRDELGRVSIGKDLMTGVSAV